MLNELGNKNQLSNMSLGMNSPANQLNMVQNPQGQQPMISLNDTLELIKSLFN